MKRITNYIIEKLNLTKNSKIIDSYSYEFFDGIKIDVPFDFFVTGKQDYVTISKIKYNWENIYETWDFFEYDKETNKYNLFVTLSKMGVKNIIVKNEQNARPLIKYFHGIKYNDYSSLEVCHHDEVVTIDEKLNINKNTVLHNPVFNFDDEKIGIQLPFTVKIKVLGKVIPDLEINDLEINSKDLYFYHDGKKILRLTNYKNYIKSFFIKEPERGIFMTLLPNNLEFFKSHPNSLAMVKFNDFTGKIIKESNEQPKYADMIVLSPEEDSILILKRSIHNNLFKRKYGFPGGKIDPKDKNPKETAIRELKEETGIELTFTEQNKCKKYDNIINKDGSITDYYIVTLEESRDVKLSNEHTSYKWYNDNIKVGFQWIPNVFQIIQKILD